MKVLICGSRNFNDYKFLQDFLKKLDITEIIHGGAKGTDTLAGDYGRSIGVPVSVFSADWTTHGRRAGYVRNTEMLKQEPELVVAFWDGKSRGTKMMIDIAKAAKVRTLVRIQGN